MRVPSVRFSPMIPMASRREANAVVPGFVRTEEGIEGRRDYGQHGLGGVIVCLLDGQRGGLGGGGNQIGLLFENGRHLQLQIGVVGDALLLEVPQ